MRHYHKLILKSMQAKIYRSIGLIMIALILSAVIVFGSLVTIGMRNGSQNVVARMGADLIVIPKGSKRDLEGILLTTQKGYFYMDASVIEKIKEIKGIEKVSPQTFLMTLEASCCDQAVQIVGIDITSDFTVTPWINKQYRKSIESGAIVIGSRVVLKDDETFQMFGKKYPVAATLGESGSSMDTTVYVSMKEIQNLLNAAKAAHQGLIEEVNENNISAIMAKISENESINAVVARLSEIEGIEIVTSDAISRQLSNELKGTYVFDVFLVGVMFAIGFLIFYMIYYMTINERREELIALRIVGMSKKMVRQFLLEETILIAGIGAALGSAFGLLSFMTMFQLMICKIGVPFVMPNRTEIIIVVISSFMVITISGPVNTFKTVRKICPEYIYANERKGE